jgi:tRNA (adenine-N(1)-)-methyltransferase non-catalytic subunit
MIPDRSLLNPTIIEPWLRQYQVLPGRTHPTMNGIAHGGYLLHAVRVFDDPGISSARAAGLGQEARAKKRKRV